MGLKMVIGTKVKYAGYCTILIRNGRQKVANGKTMYPPAIHESARPERSDGTSPTNKTVSTVCANFSPTTTKVKVENIAQDITVQGQVIKTDSFGAGK
jgi:hypothetical protein